MLRSEKQVPDDYDIDNRYDPDTEGCKELYDDEIEAFFDGMTGYTVCNWQSYNRYNRSPFYTVKVTSEVTGEYYLFSSDYIGPSVYWASKKHAGDRKIREFLTVCRRLGGHILWPRGNGNTINSARGGSGGFYDRIDWTLHLLQIFYFSETEDDYMKAAASLINNIQDRSDFIIENGSRLKRLYLAFQTYKDELMIFTDFKGFCNRFRLVGSFVDSEYNVIDMAGLYPLLPNDYLKCIDKLCGAVAERNDILHLPQK